MALSQVRQNFHAECEAAINAQISQELHACYVYMAVAAHFQRDDVALPQFHKFFDKMVKEELQHAQQVSLIIRNSIDFTSFFAILSIIFHNAVADLGGGKGENSPPQAEKIAVEKWCYFRRLYF